MTIEQRQPDFKPAESWASEAMRMYDEYVEPPRYVLGVRRRQFVCYFHFVGWSCLSLGLHVCTSLPNIEVHVPFGFIRIGWQGVHNFVADRKRCRSFGRTWQDG